MITRCMLALVVGCSALGCQQDAYLDAHIELMNAERRSLEDKMFALEADLEKCRTESERTSTAPADRDEPRSEPAEDSFSPPVIEDGVPDIPEIEIPEFDPSAQRSDPPTKRVSLGRNDPRVSRLVVRPETSVAQFDTQPGSDGLKLLFAPQNADGEFIPIAGPLNIILRDPAQLRNGAGAQIASWKVEAGVIANALRESPRKDGIYLELTWPGQPPSSDRLQLDLRYTTLDGRQLDAKHNLGVGAPGSTDWAPRDQMEDPAEVPGTKQVIRLPLVAPESSPDEQRDPAESPVAIPQWKPYR